MWFLPQLRNKISKLLGMEIIEFRWEGNLDILKLLHKYKIDADYTLDRINPPDGNIIVSLYINSLGGFIPYNTKLFIYQNKIYKK